MRRMTHADVIAGIDAIAKKYKQHTRDQILGWYAEGLITETERTVWLAEIEEPAP